MCLNFSAFDEDVALISSFKIMYTFIEAIVYGGHILLPSCTINCYS
jgi:hypothetical protein